jgi:hypothetical protein
MKKLALFLCLAGLVTSPVWAQDVDKPKLGHAYVFVAPGVATTFSCRSCTAGTIHFGGGGEGTFYKGLGVGAEIGYLGAMGSMNEGIGLASLNGIYIFRSRSHPKLDPFLTGGGTLAFAGGGLFGGLNFGGGVQYWFRKRIGLRVEFRDHIPNQDFSSHLFEGRIGFAFR